MKLYEIDQKIAEIFDNMSVDEETGEVILDTEALEALQEARTDKLEGAALYVKDLEAMAKAIREEEKALAKRRQAMEKKAERIKGWIAFNLGDEKIITPKVSISTRKGVASAKVDDVQEIAHWMCTAFVDKTDEFYKVDQALHLVYPKPVINVNGLRKLLMAGYEIPGAHLEDGKPSLQIK